MVNDDVATGGGHDWSNDFGDTAGSEPPAPQRPPAVRNLRPQARASRALARRSADRGSSAPAAIQYANVLTWVEQWLLPSWTRDLNGAHVTWCPQWWRHPEAVMRLTALWRTWEHLRMDAGTGLSVWWRDHADHHLPALLDSQGVFKGCGIKGHTTYPVLQLPSDPAPTGLFD